MEKYLYHFTANNYERLQDANPIIVDDELIGVETNLIPNNFQEVKKILEKLAYNQSIGQMLHGVQLNQHFLDILKRVFEVLPTDSTIITRRDEEHFELFHDTDDLNQVIMALKDDKLLEPPTNIKTWATRCYGLGLACNTQAGLDIPADKKRLIIRVPCQRVSLIEKRALWSSYLTHVIETIYSDNRLTNEFNTLVNLSSQGGARDQVDKLWKRLQAFNYRAYFLDAFCLLNPNITKKQLSELVQRNYYFNDGNKADHFGYRTYTDLRFLISGEMERVIAWVSNELGVIQAEHEAQKFEDLGRQIRKAGLINIDIHTGWNGVINPDDISYQKFLILQLCLNMPDLRKKLFRYEGKLSRLLNGFFPINEINIPGNLLFGTDLGGNNVAILKHFDNQTMNYEIQ